MTKKIFLIFSIFGLLIILTGCPKPIDMSQQVFLNSATKDSLNILALEPKIHRNDILYIDISVDGSKSAQEIGALYNGMNKGNNLNTNNLAVMGYLVDASGNIKIAQFGEINVLGKTKNEVVEIITSKMKKSFVVNPIINIRIINYKVFIDGEVAHPGALEVPNEVISLPQAIAMAGGFSVFAQRDDVQLIREGEDGKKILVHLDLRNTDLLEKDKEFYYLKQNDQIYIKANKEKVVNSNQSTARTVSYASTFANFILTFFLLFKK